MPAFSPLSLLIPLPFLLLSLKSSPPDADATSYLYLAFLGNSWVLGSLALHIFPLLGRHNIVTAGSLFFPAFLSTLVLLLIAKLVAFVSARLLFGDAGYPW